MPRLTGEQRRKLDEHTTEVETIRVAFQDRQWIQQHCRLCNWASNGLSFDAATAENQRHEATHPESKRLAAIELPTSDLIASLHDHDCVEGDCECKCGCKEECGCKLMFGPLCASCLLRHGRNSVHGVVVTP